MNKYNLPYNLILSPVMNCYPEVIPVAFSGTKAKAELLVVTFSYVYVFATSSVARWDL